MLWWMLQTTLITALMTAIVWILCKTLKPGPVARHALWLLMLTKFVVPPMVAWPWPVNAAVPMTRQMQGDDSMNMRALLRSLMAPEDTRRNGNTVGVSGSPEMTSSQHAAASGLSATPDPVHIASGAPRTAAAPAWRWTQQRVIAVIMCLWFAGALSMLSLQAIRILRMMQYLRSSLPAELNMQERVSRLARQMGLRPVRVLIMSTIASPYIWAFGRPSLLWPAGLPVNDALIVHELGCISVLGVIRQHWGVSRAFPSGH